MKQTELREQLKSILHKHWCKSTAAKDDYYENALNAMEEALSLNRSVPKKVTDEDIEKEALTQSSELFPEKEKHFRTSNHYDGFKAGAKWMRDKLPITLSLPESKNVPSEETESR
jgi:uncharacterized membrane protein YfhO